MLCRKTNEPGLQGYLDAYVDVFQRPVQEKQPLATGERKSGHRVESIYSISEQRMDEEERMIHRARTWRALRLVARDHPLVLLNAKQVHGDIWGIRQSLYKTGALVASPSDVPMQEA